MLLELRPAFDGHSGIPHETRLLFRGLAGMGGIDVVGLIQSSNLVVEPGLPVRGGQEIGGLAANAAIDRMSRIVVSLQQGAAAHRLEAVRRLALRLWGPTVAALLSLMGARVPLGAFDPSHFKDFLWRSLFAKSLHESDFQTVTERRYRVLRWPWSALHAVGVASGWLGAPLYPRLDTAGLDAMIVETPFPGRVSAGTKLIVRYHDAIPLLMPHTIKHRSFHRSAHYNALLRNARDGAWFACVSEATRNDLLSVLPEVAARARTIPNMLSHHFHAEDSAPARVVDVIWSRRNRAVPGTGGVAPDAGDLADGALQYLLIVGTVEPRKNHLALLDAWELLRSTGHERVHLVVVGSLGWDHDAILDRFAPWLHRGGLHLLHGVPAPDLRLLYRHARVTVCPSFGEGFDFPGVEAMRCGGVVAASDIPVHRDVFGDACTWFNPYSVESLAECLRPLLGADAPQRRSALVAAGESVASRYLPETVMPQWREFLRAVTA